jgi:hypothetical protein
MKKMKSMNNKGLAERPCDSANPFGYRNGPIQVRSDAISDTVSA